MPRCSRASPILLAAWSLLSPPASGGAEIEPAVEECRARLERAKSAIAESRMEKAESVLARCLPTARAAPPSPWSIGVRLALAETSLEAGDTGRSLTLAEEAVAEAEGLSNPGLHSGALTVLAGVYIQMGDPQRALAAFEQALPLLDATATRQARAEATKNLGIAENEMGRPDRALWYLTEALELIASEPDAGRLRVSILGNLGAVYERLGAIELALATYRDALEVATERQNPAERVDVLTRIGGLYVSAGMLKRAVEILEEARSLAAGHSSAGHRAWLDGYLTEAYRDSGDVRRAEISLIQASELHRRIGNKRALGWNLVTLGRLILNQRPGDAEDLFVAAALEVGDEDASVTARALSGRSELMSDRGDLSGAIELAEQAVDALETARGEPIALDQSPGRSVYRNAIALLLDRDLPADRLRAFELIERSLSRRSQRRVLMERIPLDRDLAPELDDRRQLVENRLAELHRRVDSGDDQERRTARRELAATQTEHAALVAAIRRQSPLFAALKYPRSVGLEQAQALLGPGMALVTYFALADEIVVFLVHRDGLEALRLPVSPEATRERIENYRALLTSGRRVEWRPASRRLARDLFSPLLWSLPVDTDSLIFVVDPELTDLPFESLLVDGDAGPAEGRFLIEDFAVTYVPSVSLLVELDHLARDRASREPVAALVIGPPTISPHSTAATEPSLRTWRSYELEGHSMAPLPGARREAPAVARYGATGTELLLGRASSERWLKRQELDRFGLIHFATHGILSSQSPSRSALLLAGDDQEDGFLQAREISRLRLAAELVVLSACRTVQRPGSQGGGAPGIATSFFHAGASSVVATLWAVDDGVTTRFMRSFYRHLAAGQSKAEALRRAKVEELSRDRSINPSQWAGFVLLGEGGHGIRVVAPTAPGLLGPMSLALLLALLIAVAVGLPSVRRCGSAC